MTDRINQPWSQEEMSLVLRAEHGILEEDEEFQLQQTLKFPSTLAILNSVKKLLLLILEETSQTHLSTSARNAFMLSIRKNLMNMMDIVLTVYLHHHQYLNQNQKLYL